MTNRNNEGVAGQTLSLRCGTKFSLDLMQQAETFAPSAGWAKANPDLALKLLFICPSPAPWLDEILN